MNANAAKFYKLNSEDNPPVRMMAWMEADGLHAIAVDTSNQVVAGAEATIWAKPDEFYARYTEEL